jgi:hypothetical protein
MPPTQTYSVRDGTKLLTFDGLRLAHISSRRPHAPRWTEMSLYRTQGGTYVYEKIGRSKVVHMPHCTKLAQPLPRFQELHPGEDPDQGYEYCGCVPAEYDFTQLLSEEDRFSTVLAESPADIVDSLYKRRGGTRELPQMAATLLDQAVANDPNLKASLETEEYID